MHAPITEDQGSDDAPLTSQPASGEGDVSVAELERIALQLLALPGNLGQKLEAIEHAALAETMRRCGHNKSEAARVLGMDRKALERRWRRYVELRDGVASSESTEFASASSSPSTTTDT